MTTDTQVQPLPCECLESLLFRAQLVADAHGEAALVLTSQPASVRRLGSDVAYVILASDARPWEREFAARVVVPGGQS